MRIANAPVSYGVFGLALPDVAPPPGAELIGIVADAGYAGIDLGPHGYLGRGDGLIDALTSRDLGLCGGWIDLPFAGPDATFDAALAAALPVLTELAHAAEHLSGPAPLPTIADSGSPARAARPGGGPDLELGAARWELLVGRVERVRRTVVDLGLVPTFHHHAGTHVETPREIDRFLADTAMDLTLDTGHLIVAGGDPVADLGRWRDRINHVHLKDVDTALLHAARGTTDPVRDLWRRRVFVPLGQGDLALAEVMATLVETGYDGWVVVEQDVVLQRDGDLDRAIADQRANRAALRRWLP